MDWFWFHCLCAAAAICYAVWDMRPLVGRQYLWGAEVLLFAVVASRFARGYSGELAPVALYGVIDIIAVLAYSAPMFRKKALWAAACVVIHTGMLALHFAFFVGGQVAESAYLWALGVLNFLAFITIIIGTAAGRHEFGRAWDDFLASRLRGWSWSGSFTSRLSAYKRKVS